MFLSASSIATSIRHIMVFIHLKFLDVWNPSDVFSQNRAHFRVFCNVRLSTLVFSRNKIFVVSISINNSLCGSIGSVWIFCVLLCVAIDLNDFSIKWMYFLNVTRSTSPVAWSVYCDCRDWFVKPRRDFWMLLHLKQIKKFSFVHKVMKMTWKISKTKWTKQERA